MTIEIGSWVVRDNVNGQAMTLGHLVESTIADRVVTKCGRQMYRSLFGAILVPLTPDDPERHCEQCDPPSVTTVDSPSDQVPG